MACVILAKQYTVVYQGFSINRLFTWRCNTLINSLESNFADSLHGWL